MKLRACLAYAALAATNLPAAEVRLEAKVFIEVQADGKHCVIHKVKVLCADAVTHLRETLKLPLGTEVGVKAHQAAPYKDVKKVLDAVDASGFKHPVAVVIAGKEKQT
jgi:biopolymer transport protein ExbD